MNGYLTFHVHKSAIEENDFKEHVNFYTGSAPSSDFVTLYTAPPKREWVGFTAAERDEIVPMLVQSLINHDDKTMTGLLRAILIDVEEQLKWKNGYGLEVCAQPTDFIGPSVFEAISRRKWVGLTDEEIIECLDSVALGIVETEKVINKHLNVYNAAKAIEAKLKEKNT